MAGSQVTTIPYIRRVIYMTYAAFPVTGLAIGDLAYATDLHCLYRWNGAAWENISPVWAETSLTNLLQNGDFEVNDPPAHWTLVGAAATFVRSNAQFRIGNYSGLLTRNGNDCHFWQGVADFTRYRGRIVTLGGWVYATVPTRAVLQLTDGVESEYSAYHSGVAGWEWLTVTLDVNAGATLLYARGYLLTGDTAAYFDGAILVEGEFCPAFSPSPAEFHSSNGTYTGNNGVNRAIPHGLGVVPKIVIITISNGTFWFRIHGSRAIISYCENTPAMGSHGVTIPDAASFYVGNAGSQVQSANANATDFDWIAIG